MNILMVGAFPEDPRFIQGGVQASVYGLAKILHTQAGMALEIIALPLKAGSSSKRRTVCLETMEVTYLSSPKYLAGGIIHLPFIFRKIRVRPQTVLHVHGTGLIQLALIGMARLWKIKHVWTLHGITEKETLQTYRKNRKPANLARHIVYTFMERLCLKMASGLIVDTPYVVNAIQRKSSVHVIPQGIFCHEFDGVDNVKREPYLIASVGVISPRKGHHHTLEAFARVKARFPGARLVIAGALPVTGYYTLLQQKVVALGLAGCVEFALNLPRSDMVALLKKARLFALHSEEESQGIALCEALAAGLPVVATRRGGIPYVVTDHKDGFLVEYGDDVAFADKMIALLEDNRRHEAMQAEANRNARRFDWHIIGKQVAEVYAVA